LFRLDRSETRYRTDSYKQYLKGVTVNKITSLYGLTGFGRYSGVVTQNLLVGTSKGLYFSSAIISEYQGNVDLLHYAGLGEVGINDLDVNIVAQKGFDCENGIWVAADDGLYLLEPEYKKFLKGRRLRFAMFAGGDPFATEAIICSEPVVARSNAINNHPVQWFKDGAEMTGEINTDLTIRESGEYYIRMYDDCTNLYILSNVLTVRSNLAPAFTFDHPAQISLCQGTETTLKISGKSGYQYRWYRDNELTDVVTNEIQVSLSGIYRAEVSSCEGEWVPTSSVEVRYTDLPVPVVIQAKNSYCFDEIATLKVDIAVSPSYTITWFRNGQALRESENMPQVKVAVPGDYSVLLKNNSGCSQSSSSKQIIFNPKPLLSIAGPEAVLCEGQSFDLKASHSAGTVSWSTGETSEQISVTRPGKYRATLTTATGCIAEAEINVSFMSRPVLAVRDTVLCQMTGETVLLRAPTGFKSYSWNGIRGAPEYIVRKAGTVSLTVENDNGCTQSQGSMSGSIVTRSCRQILLLRMVTE
jgi:hypothetical protein